MVRPLLLKNDMSQTSPVIVVATDFSPGSEAALRAAARLWSKDTRLTIHLVHALEPLTFVAPPGAYWSTYDKDRTREVRQTLSTAATRLRKRLGPRVKIAQHLLAGPVDVEICQLAKRQRADLIVVGTHGRTGLAHVLIGSVAERVVRHAGRPVLTVPLPKRRPRAVRR